MQPRKVEVGFALTVSFRGLIVNPANLPGQVVKTKYIITQTEQVLASFFDIHLYTRFAFRARAFLSLLIFF